MWRATSPRRRAQTASSGAGGRRARSARPARRRRSRPTSGASGETAEAAMRRTVAILATLGVAVGFLVLADRVLGRVADPRFTPLAGPPGTTRLLVRPEFRVRVRTNAAGFRGGPLPG